jgi:hypothetical protein
MAVSGCVVVDAFFDQAPRPRNANGRGIGWQYFE